MPPIDLGSFEWPPAGSGSGGGVTIYANFAAFPPTAPVGTLAIDASTGTLYEYFGGSWQVLAELGSSAGVFYQQNLTSQITGSNNTFTLSFTPASAAALVIFLNTRYLDQSQYTLAGNVVTITSGTPKLGNSLSAVGLAATAAAGVASLNTLTGPVSINPGTGIGVSVVGQDIVISNTAPAAAVPYAGTVSLGSGISSKAVVFTNPLGSLPAVVCWISSSNSAASIITSQGSGISAAGFTAQLSATTPDATYSLNWIASVAND